MTRQPFKCAIHTIERACLLLASQVFCAFFSLDNSYESRTQTHSVSTWQSSIRAQMISTATALINSNNPNILIQLYTSENDLTNKWSGKTS